MLGNELSRGEILVKVQLKVFVHAFAHKRKLRNTHTTIAETLSESAVNLLAGLLSVDPTQRLTLGESSVFNLGESVWDEEWAQMGSN